MSDLTEDERWSFANEIADYISVHGERLGFTDAALIVERLLESESWVEWLTGVRAGVWDEAIATSRSILARRAPNHYETDIDLIVEPNPYGQERQSRETENG